MNTEEREKIRKKAGAKFWPSRFKPRRKKEKQLDLSSLWGKRGDGWLREWRKNNPTRVRAHNHALHEKRKVDPKEILLRRLRKRLSKIARKHSTKVIRFPRHEFIGCSRPELVSHIEKQFKVGMSWENRHLWHIDHIRPCASFDLTDPEQIKLCFHYTNLQPLWAIENINKGSKLA